MFCCFFLFVNVNFCDTVLLRSPYRQLKFEEKINVLLSEQTAALCSVLFACAGQGRWTVLNVFMKSIYILSCCHDVFDSKKDLFVQI